MFGLAWFFFVLFFVCIFAAIFCFNKARAMEAKSYTPPDPFETVPGAHPFGPKSLGPGAIISYGGVDYVVRGTLTLRQGPYQWFEHLLDGGDGSNWLGVEIDEGELGLVWWTTRKGSGLSPDSYIEFEGVKYVEQERGHARFTSRGTTGLPEAGEMGYIDYSSPSSPGQRLGFEGWAKDDSWEVSTGHELLPQELTVYPAPEQGQ